MNGKVVSAMVAVLVVVVLLAEGVLLGRLTGVLGGAGLGPLVGFLEGRLFYWWLLRKAAAP